MAGPHSNSSGSASSPSHGAAYLILTQVGTSTSDDSERALDTGLAGRANNLCGIIEGGVAPDLVASRLSSLGWEARSASWYSYETENRWCRIEIDQTDDGTTLINGVIDPQQIDDLSRLFAGLGWRHSLELSDQDGSVVQERRH